MWWRETGKSHRPVRALPGGWLRIACWGWLLPALLLSALAPPSPAQAAAAGSSPGVENTPLDIVVLVDESGSESALDIKHEAEAAGTIAQTPLNPRSRVTIIGFGGADGAALSQVPTAVVCQPTVTQGAANLEYLARCVSKLHRRTVAEGDNTDYAAALSQAMSFLSPGTPYGDRSPAGATKAILFMTDGGLDVSGDPQYPQPNWLPAAKHDVNLQLAAARAAGVQVWPLGFGSISGTNARYLRYIAAHGAQQGCDRRDVSRPHAIVAQNSAKALGALYELYSAAACLGTTNGGSTVVPGGQTRTLSVNIPAIASDGVISVNKGSPAIRVDYLTPGGTLVNGGSLGGSTFQRSGQDTAVEVLHVSNPQPGNWQIRLTAPKGLGSQLVSATAFWQGAVRVAIFPSPAQVRPGQRIAVTLSVLGANGPIMDPAQLSGMQMRLSVAGDGLSAPLAIPLRPAAASSGSGLAAGDYAGTFTAPSTPGTLTFTGTAAGYGLHATDVPVSVSVGTPAALLQGTVQFNAPDTVEPGQDIPGQITFRNQTGQTRRVRLVLSASHALATVSSPRGALTVPSGTTTAPFSVTMGSNTPLGPASLVVRVADASRLAVSYGSQQLLVTVQPSPTIPERYRWEIIGAALLLLLTAGWLSFLRLRHKRAVDVRGLVAVLVQDGQTLHELKAQDKWADTFPFMIRDEEHGQPLLDYPQPGERGYRAQRRVGRRDHLHGKVTVTSADGVSYHLTPGGAGEPLPSGVQLALRDTRAASLPLPPPPPMDPEVPGPPALDDIWN